ncbi:hypothetical protein CDD80_366 [Ophiocordyceps camponoti-rufipedis]|uniref:Uncharacterized protein n=1 Tax=Ophiocordyceps camponoti-rufipedis TaxID=2004952 RepID=A0A2C5ZKY6_9HYPO|nr:hypothetical protein CDD80_366 [Ophiocordyceps camponoti-rufipedis]
MTRPAARNFAADAWPPTQMSRRSRHGLPHGWKFPLNSIRSDTASPVQKYRQSQEYRVIDLTQKQRRQQLIRSGSIPTGTNDGFAYVHRNRGAVGYIVMAIEPCPNTQSPQVKPTSPLHFVSRASPDFTSGRKPSTWIKMSGIGQDKFSAAYPPNASCPLHRSPHIPPSRPVKS